MDVSKFFEAIKLSPKYLAPIVFISGFLLFAKPEILDVFGLAVFTAKYRPFVGGIFLLSSALILSHCVISVYEWVARRRALSRRIKHSTKRLHNLTHEERELLRRYIGGNTRTQYLHLEDGVASGLELEYIIFRSSNVGSMTEGWAYNIQPWAWAYLNKHIELLFSKNELESGEWQQTSDRPLRWRRW